MSEQPRIGCLQWKAGVAACGLFYALSAPLTSLGALTPEQETRKLSQSLKPITDDVWTKIAGERASQQYGVVNGDNLYDISKRLFGDPKYWPKIWAINNGKIINPHLIFPGNQVAFLGGSGVSLPSVGVKGEGGESMTDSESGDGLFGKDRAQEWRELPRQSWEDTNLILPPNVDPQGFDRSNKIKFSASTGFDILSFVSESELPYLGEITGARKEAFGLALGDVAYIRSLRELQVGESYSITQEPIRIKGHRSGRKGYAYLHVGRIKIISVRDGLFVGTVTASFQPTARGFYLIPSLGRVQEPEIIPGPEALQGNIISDLRISSSYIAQFKQVFIDRGADDGVKPGMVFRAYQHEDPATKKVITESDFIIHSDFMVVQTYEKFSLAWALSSVSSLADKSPVVLLTDVTDLLREPIDAPASTEKIDQELDELDRLDPGGEMGDKEKRELKQLEKWKEDKINGQGDSENLPRPPGDEVPPPEEAPPEGAPEGAPEEAPAEPAPTDEAPTAPVESAPSEPVAPEEAAPPADGGLAPESAPPEAAPSDVAPDANLNQPEAPSEPAGLPDEPPPPPEMSE